jgi:hypothetical protein
MLQNERPQSFVTVTCSCGRTLRAKSDQVETEVRCWDCRKMVLVPNPRRRERVARELSEGALVVIKGPGLNSVLIAASAVTALLAIPEFGVWCAVAALTVGGLDYGEAIRRVSRGRTGEPAPEPWSWLKPELIPRFVVALLMALGTILPLWWFNAGFHQSPHWNRTSRLIAAAAWVLGPPVMFLICARTPDNTRLSLLTGAKTLARHPLATLLALGLVPASLLMAEILLTAIIYLGGHLPFFALDYMPMPVLAKTYERPVIYTGIPHYHMIDYRSYPESMFLSGYVSGLRHGYTFTGALPASLSLPTRAGLDAEEAIGLLGPSYLIIRLLFVLTIVTSLIAAFAIQARWLGAIPALDPRWRSARLPPTLAPSLPTPGNDPS